MAYADANTSSRKLTAGVAVIALEAGLAWALITGLAYTAMIKREHNTKGIPIPTFTPEPLPKQPPVKQAPKAPPIVPRTQVPLAPPDPFPTPYAEPSSGLTGGGDAGTSDLPGNEIRPTPTPAPKPLFTPKRAVPRGDTTRWLTTDDYPTRGLREEHEGRTGYRLTIDSAGRVTSCTVTSSSGHDELDQTTCQLLPRRAKFEAARDDTGNVVSGSYSGSVTWRLPPEE